MKNENQHTSCDQCGETYPSDERWTKERCITNKDGSAEEVVNLCRHSKCESVYVQENKLNHTGAYSVSKDGNSIRNLLRDTKLRADGVDFTRSTDLKY
jgi:hypothetical protein